MLKILICIIFTISIIGCKQQEESSFVKNLNPSVENQQPTPALDLPQISISNPSNINNSNLSTYLVAGNCSEQSQNVEVTINSITNSTSCLSGSYNVSFFDLSDVLDGPVDIVAKHFNAQGLFGTVTANVDKDTQTAIVSINNLFEINSINESDFVVEGTCSENTEVVSVSVGGINKQPACSSGTWSTGITDVSSLADGEIFITANHSNAIQASATVNKDSTIAVVTILSAPDISSTNHDIYLVSGECTQDSESVELHIGSISESLVCNLGTWSSGFVDVSSLDDGDVTITADHSTAGQSSVNVQKTTSSPTASDLSSPTSLVNSVDLNWSINLPDGFIINDYIVNYKVKDTSLWLTFDDGVSVNTYATVTGLNPNMTYEFRVKVIYDTDQQSSWSNISEGTTQPDSDVFGVNKAMNVGGATASTVVVFEDQTNVTLNGSVLITLNKGESHSFVSSQFDIIDADKPIFTAGKIGTGTGSNNQGNIVWQPTAWAGKSFSLNATRSNPQEVYVFAVEDTYIEVKQGSTILDSLSLSEGQSGTLNWSTYGSYQVLATGSILAFHMSRASGLYYDPKPLMPGHTEVIGFPSSSARLTSINDGTSYNLIHSNSSTSSGSLNKADVITINPQGTSSLFQSESTIIKSNKKISAASFADSNGYCAAPFMPTNLMKKKYTIPVDSDFIAFASKSSGSIEVFDSADVLVTTLTLTQTGSDPNAPYKVRMTNPSAGYRFIATVDVAAWYQSSISTNAAAQDETILYGTNE